MGRSALPTAIGARHLQAARAPDHPHRPDASRSAEPTSRAPNRRSGRPIAIGTDGESTGKPGATIARTINDLPPCRPDRRARDTRERDHDTSRRGSVERIRHAGPSPRDRGDLRQQRLAALDRAARYDDEAAGCAADAAERTYDAHMSQLLRLPVRPIGGAEKYGELELAIRNSTVDTD